MDTKCKETHKTRSGIAWLQSLRLQDEQCLRKCIMVRQNGEEGKTVYTCSIEICGERRTEACGFIILDIHRHRHSPRLGFVCGKIATRDKTEINRLSTSELVLQNVWFTIASSDWWQISRLHTPHTCEPTLRFSGRIDWFIPSWAGTDRVKEHFDSFDKTQFLSIRMREIRNDPDIRSSAQRIICRYYNKSHFHLFTDCTERNTIHYKYGCLFFSLFQALAAHLARCALRPRHVQCFASCAHVIVAYLASNVETAERQRHLIQTVSTSSAFCVLTNAARIVLRFISTFFMSLFEPRFLTLLQQILFIPFAIDEQRMYGYGKCR